MVKNSPASIFDGDGLFPARKPESRGRPGCMLCVDIDPPFKVARIKFSAGQRGATEAGLARAGCPQPRTPQHKSGFLRLRRMMASMRVQFLKSGAQAKDYPFPYKPEVAIAGRSNAGKSSFINALTASELPKYRRLRKNPIAQFFELDQSLYLVDMPGYGFATAVAKKSKAGRKWSKPISVNAIVSRVFCSSWISARMERRRSQLRRVAHSQ